MSRQVRRFLDIADSLDRELTKRTELFFELRPFLDDSTVEPKILERSDDFIERKVDNDIAIERIIRRINL